MLAVLLSVYSRVHRQARQRHSGGPLGWTGLVYHWQFFAAINPVAAVFGAAFVGQALVWAFAGMVRGRLRFRIGRDLPSLAGAVFVVYAMVLYPIIGHLLGHGYPRSPSFGVTPCPLTIFTFGLLLWSRGRVPSYVLAIPLAWSFIGIWAAVSLGIVEDVGLFVAALVGTTSLSGPAGRPATFGRWHRGMRDQHGSGRCHRTAMRSGATSKGLMLRRSGLAVACFGAAAVPVLWQLRVRDVATARRLRARLKAAGSQAVDWFEPVMVADLPDPAGATSSIRSGPEHRSHNRCA